MYAGAGAGEGARCGACLRRGPGGWRGARGPAQSRTLALLQPPNATTVSAATCWECASTLKKATILRLQLEKVAKINFSEYNDTLLEQLSLKSRLRLSPVVTHDNITPIECISHDKIKFEEVDTNSFEFSENFEDFPEHKLEIEDLVEKVKVQRTISRKKRKEKPIEDFPEHKLEIEGLVKKAKVQRTISRKKRKEIPIEREERTREKTKKKCMKDSAMFTVIKLSVTEIAQERLRDLRKDSYLKLRYKCSDCVVGFDFEEKYNDHVAKKHNKKVGKHHCDMCNTFFACPRTLSNHRMRHRRRFQCRRCDRRAIDKEVIVKHYTTEHESTERRYSCDACGKESTSIRKHRYHVQTHTERPQCHHCGRIFTCKNNLRCHLLRHEGAGVGSFRCDECGRQYKGKSGLAAHMLATHSAAGAVQQYYCALCDTNYQTSSSYGQHLRTSNKHVPPNKRRFACSECGQRFATDNLLNRHTKAVHQHKAEYECDHCHKRLSSAWHLTRHVKYVHERAPRPRNHVCHVCGQTFTSMSILKSHMRCHDTAERHLSCDDCNEIFTQLSELYTHNEVIHNKHRSCKTGTIVVSGDKNKLLN